MNIYVCVFLWQRSPQPKDLSHNTVDEWELPKESFTLEHKLGSGFFADVYRGKWKNSTSVAIKVLKNNGKLLLVYQYHYVEVNDLLFQVYKQKIHSFILKHN